MKNAQGTSDINSSRICKMDTKPKDICELCKGHTHLTEFFEVRARITFPLLDSKIHKWTSGQEYRNNKLEYFPALQA